MFIKYVAKLLIMRHQNFVANLLSMCHQILLQINKLYQTFYFISLKHISIIKAIKAIKAINAIKAIKAIKSIKSIKST